MSRFRPPLPRSGPAVLAPGRGGRRRPACHLVLLVGLAALGGSSVPAQQPVRLLLPDGPVEARLAGWGEDGPLLADRETPPDWLGLELPPAGPQPPPAPAPWQLELNDGSWLPGSPGLGDGGTGSWRLPNGLSVDFDTLLLRRVGRSPGPFEAEDRDLLWLRSAAGGLDRLRGWLLDWRPAGLVFEGPAGEVEYPWDRIEALEVVPEEPEPAGAGWVWLVLADGGFLRCRPEPGGAEAALRVVLPGGGRLEVSWSSLRALHPIAGDGLVDAAWRVRERPDLRRLEPGPCLGRSVEGRPLRAGGREYPDGLGLRAPSILTRPLDRGGTFVAWAAIDQEAALCRAPQAFRFLVRFDGRELAVTPPLRAGDRPVLVRAELPGPGELGLEVRPEGPLPFGGHADWLLPRLLAPPAGS
ncbi:MAG: hypothetical protein D6702_10945 [Planctomycetota bacterium]|nr:MAG: hypothetical protein D6702_10945 [Planctomycetota bacterium]